MSDPRFEVMSEGEVLRRWKDALKESKGRCKELTTLSELCACSEDAMKEWLAGHGLDTATRGPLRGFKRGKDGKKIVEVDKCAATEEKGLKTAENEPSESERAMLDTIIEGVMLQAATVHKDLDDVELKIEAAKRVVEELENKKQVLKDKCAYIEEVSERLTGAEGVRLIGC